MIGEATFPQRMQRNGNMEDLSYMALVGMRKEHQFPVHYSNKCELIILTVCIWFGITEEELLRKKRDREIVEPRQICMFLLYKYSGLPLKKIAKRMGGYDHTTVIHSYQKIRDLMDVDVRIRQTVQALEIKIQ